VRPIGISALISVHNEDHLLEPCVRSFVPWVDEVIVVENNSTDKSFQVAKKLAKRYKKVRVFSITCSDLYHNRRFALQQSKYQYIIRGDSDFVCIPDVCNNLRKALLSRNHSRLAVFRVKLVTLFGDFWHTRLSRMSSGLRKPSSRIFSWHDGLNFVKVGKRETTAVCSRAKRIVLKDPLFFHVTVKKMVPSLIRASRPHWRMQKSKKFRTVEDYALFRAKNEWGCSSIEEAARVRSRVLAKTLVKYDPDNYYAYPPEILQAMKTTKIKVVYKNGSPYEIIDS